MWAKLTPEPKVFRKVFNEVTEEELSDSMMQKWLALSLCSKRFKWPV